MFGFLYNKMGTLLTLIFKRSKMQFSISIEKDYAHVNVFLRNPVLSVDEKKKETRGREVWLACLFLLLLL